MMMKNLNENHRQALALTRNISRAGGSQCLCFSIRSIARWVRARHRGGEEGGALVEFALVVPLMLTMITGIFAVGIAFNNQLTLTQAVGAGAQHLQVVRSTTSDPCSDTFSAITAAAPNLKSDKIALTITINGGTPLVGNTCASSTSTLQGAQGEPVTVAATYPCNLQISGVKISSGCQLAATVTEYEY
jgi:Flp pilus assembly protein TadG